MSNIYEISQRVRNVYEELADGIGIDQETGEIDEAIQKELYFNDMELQNKAIDYGFVIKSFDDDIMLLDNEIKRLTARKKKLENARKWMKETIVNAMVEFGHTKIKNERLELSIRESKAVNIDDMDAIPQKYKRTKVVVDIDKIGIRDDLKAGIEVPGASIGINKSLQIK